MAKPPAHPPLLLRKATSDIPNTLPSHLDLIISYPGTCKHLQASKQASKPRPLQTARLFRLAAGAALDAARRGAVDVVAGDPALVVALAAVAAARGAGRLGARQGLGLDHDLARGLLAARALDGAGLREERLDPRLVDKVQGRAEDAGEDEVEEDAGRRVRCWSGGLLRGDGLTFAGRRGWWAARRCSRGRCGPGPGRPGWRRGWR